MKDEAEAWELVEETYDDYNRTRASVHKSQFELVLSMWCYLTGEDDEEVTAKLVREIDERKHRGAKPDPFEFDLNS